jgi:hypothetical protein
LDHSSPDPHPTKLVSLDHLTFGGTIPEFPELRHYFHSVRAPRKILRVLRLSASRANGKKRYPYYLSKPGVLALFIVFGSCFQHRCTTTVRVTPRSIASPCTAKIPVNPSTEAQPPSEVSSQVITVNQALLDAIFKRHAINTALPETQSKHYLPFNRRMEERMIEHEQWLGQSHHRRLSSVCDLLVIYHGQWKQQVLLRMNGSPRYPPSKPPFVFLFTRYITAKARSIGVRFML